MVAQVSGQELNMHSPEWFEKRDIDKYLESIGAYVVKPATFGQGKSGVPDRVCCIHGTFVGIEVKRPGKDPTAVQERRMGEVQQAGGIAIWGTAEKVIGELKALFG
jgi:hypothetical protein